MTGAELVAARGRLGLTLDGFAAEIGLTPHVVSAWEAGAIAIPGRYEADLAWRLALQDREDALKASGLPDCPWIADWHSQPFPVGLKAQTKHLESGVAHAKVCPTCIARERFTQEKFGDLPRRPVARGLGVMTSIGEAIARLPVWLRPVASAVLLALAFTFIQVLFAFPGLDRFSEGMIEAVQKLGTGAAIGAVIGFVISFARFAARWIAK